MGMIKIKCPTCGAILSVADDPSNVRKSVKCPVCEEKHRFTEFKSVQNKTEESDRTQLGINARQSDRTELPMQSRPVTFGYLLDETHNRKYTLCAGLNLIGRKLRFPSKPTISVSAGSTSTLKRSKDLTVL